MPISTHLRPVQLLAPGAALTATTKSLVLDRYGWAQVAVLACLGTPGATLNSTNNLTMAIQESDTTNDADFTAVPAASLLYGFVLVASAAQASRIQRAEYTGTKRYLRLLVTALGTVSLPVVAIALLGGATVETLSAPDVGLAAT
jgi:hypothetical protein